MSSEEEQHLSQNDAEDKTKKESDEVSEPASAPSGQRAFNVQPVTSEDIAPESKPPPAEEGKAHVGFTLKDQGSDDDAPASPGFDRTISSEPHFTQGYTTNEAVPMTMFYRGNTRPTLQQLREGTEGKVCSHQYTLIHFTSNVCAIKRICNEAVAKVGWKTLRAEPAGS